MALVRVAERSSLPLLPYQRKRTCARNDAGAVSTCTRWVKTKPLLARPGTDFCHTPSFGALTAENAVAGGMRTKSSKRIHIRFVPATAGIDPTNVAVRSVAAGPLWHAESLARSAGACACPAAGRARAARTMSGATRRTALQEQRRRRKVAGLPGVGAALAPSAGAVGQGIEGGVSPPALPPSANRFGLCPVSAHKPKRFAPGGAFATQPGATAAGRRERQGPPSLGDAASARRTARERGQLAAFR